ncbi:hypothetical protein C8R43DRAFT_314414 [Mycena crocata]|nr:hypothetical protein C8R43DRAFT_314414 [Mycena crocata]
MLFLQLLQHFYTTRHQDTEFCVAQDAPPMSHLTLHHLSYMATSRPSQVSGKADPPVHAEIEIIGVTNKSSLHGEIRSFVSIRFSSLTNFRVNTKVSRTGRWNHNLPSLPLSLLTVVKLEIKQRRPWIWNKTLATSQTTVQDLLDKMDQNNTVAIPLKYYRPHLLSPMLSLCIKVADLDIGLVSARLATLKPGTSPNPHEHFQQILRRLEQLTRFSSAIAQIHPLSNLVHSLGKGVAQTITERFATEEKLSKLMQQMHSALEFVELAEPETIGALTDVVQEILACITEWIIFISGRERANPALKIISDHKFRIEKLGTDLQELRSRMTEFLTLGVAQRNIELNSKVQEINISQHLNSLKPLSMDSVAPAFGGICLPDTRTKVISELTEWALVSENKVLWMHAHAGSGKSTLSTTLANRFTDFGVLGSFVFFNRDVAQRSEPSGMIRTIAYQLGRHRKDIAECIRSCMEELPRITDMGLDVQFRRLLVEPLAKINSHRRVIIIIDALDEGGDGPGQESFLSVLSSGLSQLPHYVRVMITSRRYPSIERALLKVHDVQALDLNQAPDINDDIRTYIWTKMDEIRSELTQSGTPASVPPEWPGADVVDHLVQQANGLFIWATVACSYIKKYKPTDRVQTLLSNPSVRAEAEYSLNGLYAIAIRDAGPWNNNDFSTDMHKVLAVIIVSQNPQSTQCIGDMLGVSNTLIISLLSRLQSILEIDTDGLVRVIHPSVREYLVDSMRCDPTLPWFIDEGEEHALMATHCIRYLQARLKRNMVSHPSGNIPPSKGLPDAVSYSCVAWVYHVRKVTPNEELVYEVQKFTAKHFLHWLEALSILGESRSAIIWLDQMRDWYSKFNMSPASKPAFQIMLYDCWRFAKTFSKTIEARPALVYETALPFCPKNTAIFAAFNSDRHITVVSGGLQEWSPSLMTLTGFFMGIESLTTSKSGHRIAAGCINGTIKVWDTSQGIEIWSTPKDPGPQTEHVIATQLSSDGTELVYGLVYGEIYRLDVDTGTVRTKFTVRDGLHGLKTHLHCVALAADDRTIGCGFQDGKVQLWDGETRKPLTPLLHGHDDEVNCVAFSYDQQRIISGSNDRSIRLWNRNGYHEHTFLGHSGYVNCVAFSPDDSRVASASSDATLRIWDVSTGSVLVQCKHRQDELLYSVSFSNKGDRVATGTHLWAIRIWDTQTGAELMSPLVGHRGYVAALAFGSDDKTIITGSGDSHVRIFSLERSQSEVSVQPGHTNFVNCVAIAHDKSFFISGSNDHSIIVWNTRDGHALFPPLLAHNDGIVAVDVSPDDTMLASGSRDGHIFLWDLRTGKVHGPPLVHTDQIISVKFSADGSRLASVTKENTLTLWCIAQANILLGPFLHPGRTCQAVAFSHDGQQVAVLYDYVPEDCFGLGFTIRDAIDGTLLFETTIDSDVDGEELYAVKMEYTADDKHLVIWYGLSFTAPDEVFIRAFNAATGTEYTCQSGSPTISEFNRPVAVDMQIIQHGAKFAELPLDLDFMGDIISWASTDEMIVVGTRSGEVYCISLTNQ